LARRTDEIQPVSLAADDLRVLLAELCPDNRIDLAGAVVLPCPLLHHQRWLDWASGEKAGGLDYLTRDPAGRTDPTVRNRWARSLLVFAQRYTDGWPVDDPDPAAGGSPGSKAPWTARVSRYARGRDYHDVLLGDIRAVLAGLRERWPELAAFPSVDTGPYLEREYAWLAGLGFLGRNRCLIHEKLGSGLFLGVALTNLEITGLPPAGTPAVEPLYSIRPRRSRPPVVAPLDICGRCRRCLEACPTGALDPETGLDAGRCLSTWTIEWRGRVPAGQEHLQGGILFGCDICQSVCPWNRKAAGRTAGLPPVRREYAVLPEHGELSLAGLAGLADEEFRQRFRRTPIWRCHPEGLRRNAAVVLANLEEEEP